MEDPENIRDDDARRKRLDELFADEPHLSPTMKARRLHEKLNGLDAPSDLPVRAFVPDVRPLSADASPVQPLSWHACTAYFHGRFEASRLDEESVNKLGELGRDTLFDWLRRLPRDDS